MHYTRGIQKVNAEIKSKYKKGIFQKELIKN